MVDVVGSGHPALPPLEYGEEAAAALSRQESPTWSEAIQAIGENDSPLGYIARSGAIAGADLDSPTLTPEQANETYKLPTGESMFTAPVRDNVAKLMYDSKMRELANEQIASRFMSAHNLPAQLAVGMAAFMRDPLNIASMFVPGVSESKLLDVAPWLGTTGSRLVAGASAGAAGQVPLVALKGAAGTSFDSDYGAREAFSDLFYAAVPNAAIHAGFGAIGDFLRSRAGEPSRTPPGVADAVIQTAETKHAAMSSATADLVEGRTVDVTPIIDAADANRPPMARPTAAEDFWEEGHPLPPPETRMLDFARSIGIEPERVPAGNLERVVDHERVTDDAIARVHDLIPEDGHPLPPPETNMLAFLKEITDASRPKAAAGENRAPEAGGAAMEEGGYEAGNRASPAGGGQQPELAGTVPAAGRIIPALAVGAERAQATAEGARPHSAEAGRPGTAQSVGGSTGTATGTTGVAGARVATTIKEFGLELIHGHPNSWEKPVTISSRNYIARIDKLSNGYVASIIPKSKTGRGKQIKSKVYKTENESVSSLNHLMDRKFLQLNAQSGIRDIKKSSSGKPVDALQFIASKGGLRDDEGHDILKGMGAPKFIPGYGALIRKDGLSLDELGEALYLNRYMPKERPSTSEVLDYLSESFHGKKQYSFFDKTEIVDIEAMEKSKKNKDIEDRELFAIRDLANELHVTLSETEERMIIDYIANGMSHEDALTEALEREAIRNEEALAHGTNSEHWDEDWGVEISSSTKENAGEPPFGQIEEPARPVRSRESQRQQNGIQSPGAKSIQKRPVLDTRESAPGVPAPDLAEAKAELFPEKKPEPVEPASKMPVEPPEDIGAAKQLTDLLDRLDKLQPEKEEQEAVEGINPAEVDPDIAMAEASITPADLATMTAEEKAALAEGDTAEAWANQCAAAIEEAAQCLTGKGD